MNTPTNQVIAPLHIRRLRGKMEIKMLTMRAVSEMAGVPYTTASAILCGRMVHPAYLRRIQEAIEAAPMPELQPA